MILNTGKSLNSLLVEQNRGLQNNKYNINTKLIAFKGAGGLGVATNNLFSLIQTHEIAGPTLVNTFSMVIPRSLIDSTRSPEAGVETARRETTSLVSSSLMPGFYALGIGGLMGLCQGVKGNLPVNNSLMNHFKDAWDGTSANDENRVQKYLKNSLKNARRYVNGKPKSLPKEINKASEIIDKYIKDNLADKTSKDALKNATEDVVKILKTEQEIRLGSVDTSVGQLIRSSNEMMVEVFKNPKYETPEKINEAFKKMSDICKKRTVAGLGIAATIALGTQYVNRHLTKLKTGSSAFVGLPNYEDITEHKHKDDSFNWKLASAKAGSVGAMVYMLGATLSEHVNPKKMWKYFSSNPGKLGSKLQFKGNFPSLNQLRVLSTITYSGRMLAASDSNELRETNIRDMFGYLNWLVFGGFVTKLAGHSMSGGKLCVEKDSLKEGAGWLERKLHVVKNTYLMTEHEIKAMHPNKKFAKKLIYQKNVAIGLGLLYSTAVLGAGIPLFNKYLTNKIVSKKVNKQKFDRNKGIVETTFGHYKNDSLMNNLEFSLIKKHNKKIFFNDFLKLKQNYTNS